MLFFLKDISSEERFHVELHFSPGVKGVEEEENAPTGFGFRPASAEVARQVESHPSISAVFLFADISMWIISFFVCLFFFSAHSERAEAA